jgi:LmbE family N-acetylglucosaminyl deacetylase
VCAADPPDGELSEFAAELHARWETGAQAGEQRRREDAASCREMGAAPRHFAVQDCVYRRDPQGGWLYPTVMHIFGELHPEDEALTGALAREMEAGLPAGAQVVCPLGLGNHVDHQLTRRAAERLGLPLWYYADYPYVLQNPEQLAALPAAGWSAHVFPVSQAGLEAWGRSIAAHASQLSTFWPDLASMRSFLQAYWQPFEGVQLWRPGAA